MRFVFCLLVWLMPYCLICVAQSPANKTWKHGNDAPVYVSKSNNLQVLVKPFKVTAAGAKNQLGTDLQQLLNNAIDKYKAAEVIMQQTDSLQPDLVIISGKITEFEMQNKGKLVSRWDGTRGTGDPTISLRFQIHIKDPNTDALYATEKFNVEATAADTTGDINLWKGIKTADYNKIEAAGIYKGAKQVVDFLIAEKYKIISKKEEARKTK